MLDKASELCLHVTRAPVTYDNLHLLRHHAMKCKIPGCGCRQAFASLFLSNGEDFQPRVQRCAITRDHIVQVMTERFVCKVPDCPCHKIRGEYGNALHDSIYKMVFKLARRYSVTCPDDEINDLSQMCHLRIIKMLHHFDSERGEFTTWAWRLCENTLRRHYKCSMRGAGSFDSLEEQHENIGKCDHSNSLMHDILSTVAELKRRHPSWAKVISIMFNEKGGDAVLPNKIVVADVARLSGCQYNKVSHFYNHVVCPFFKERFQPQMEVPSE
jgi:hypothetical protein